METVSYTEQQPEPVSIKLVLIQLFPVCCDWLVLGLHVVQPRPPANQAQPAADEGEAELWSSERRVTSEELRKVFL